MSTARIHHYVPQCYLKRFTPDGLVTSNFFALDFLDKKSFWPTPGSVCGVRDFNRVEIPDQPIDALESALAGFDDLLDKALDTIERDRDLRDDHATCVLLNFASNVAVRNPRFRAQQEGFQRRLQEHAMRMVVADREIYEFELRSAKKAGYVAESMNVPFEQMREFIERRKYTIEFPHGYHVVTEFDAQDTVLRTMAARNWLLLRAGGSNEFITSDLPVILLPVQGSRMPAGFGIEGTTVLLPISPTLLAMGTFDGPEGVCDIPSAHVASWNTTIAFRSTRFVFARSDKFQALDPDDRVIVGSALLEHVTRRKILAQRPVLT